jgi:hypothetical protein
MKHIILIFSLFTTILLADTVGVNMDSWNQATNDEISLQKESSTKQSQTIDPQLIEEIKAETQRQKDSLSKSQTISSSTQTQKEQTIIQTEPKNRLLEPFKNFFAPIVEFAKRYPWQLVTLLLGFTFLTYLSLFGPLLNRLKNQIYDEEIDIKNHAIKKVESKPDGKLLTNLQYSKLKGELNESYIYKKEEILLSNELDQEDKNRELVMLEWKYNQILNLSLPKLEDEDAQVFSSGIKELLDEKESREITRRFFRDLIQSNSLEEKAVQFLEHIIR